MKRNGFILSSSAIFAIIYSSSVFAAEYKIEEFENNIIYLNPNSQTQSENLQSFPITVKDMNNDSNELAAQSIQFRSDERLLTDYIQQEFCRKVKFKIANGQLQIISAPKKINTMMTCYFKPRSKDRNITLTAKQKSLEIKFNYDFETWIEQPDYLDATKIAKYIDTKYIKTKINTNSEEITLDREEFPGNWYNHITLDLSPIYLTNKFPNLKKLNIRSFYINSHNLNSFAFPNAPSLKHLSYTINKFSVVKKDSFRSLINLKTLDLKANGIWKLEDNSFEGLEHLEILGLQNNYISAISENTFAGLVNLKELDLSNNTPLVEDNKWIQMVLNGGPVLPKLEKLSITSSIVGKIDEIFFQSMPKLSILKLERNALTEIPENIFTNNPLLKEVDLSHNKIQKISSLGNTKIVNLNLSENKIEFLDDNFFNSIQKIEDLNLSNNSIHTFNKSSFSEQLKLVNLGNNELTFIPNKLSKSLEGLKIYSNNINKLNGTELDQYPNLMSINFFGNQMTQIPSDTFKAQNMLKELDLSENKFEEVPANSFQHLANLETLNISNNSLQSINSNSFDGLINLKNLHLDNNKIPLAFNIDHNIRLDSISILYSLSEDEVERVKKLFEGSKQITIHNYIQNDKEVSNKSSAHNAYEY